MLYIEYRTGTWVYQDFEVEIQSDYFTQQLDWRYWKDIPHLKMLFDTLSFSMVLLRLDKQTLY